MNPFEDQPERSQVPQKRPSQPDRFSRPVYRRPPLARSSMPTPVSRVNNIQESADYQANNSHTQSSEPKSLNEPLASPPQEGVEVETIYQMPQPESLTPPQEVIAQMAPESAKVQVGQIPAQQTPTAPSTPRQTLDFTPPPSINKRNWLRPTLTVTAVALVMTVGIFGYTRVMAAKNNPDTVMKDALSNSLSLSTVQSTTRSGDNSTTTKYDFSDTKNPLINSSTSTKTAAGQLMLNGYGDLKNTYINYASLPKTVKAKTARQLSSSWVQIRQGSRLPEETPSYVLKASDPRYQVFSPLIMGNFSGQAKEQLLDFIIKNKVYGYDAEKVKKEKLGDETVLTYPIKLDVSYLKVASQSAALSMGLEPTDTQMAVDEMDHLQGASVTIYIRAKDHTFARMYISKDGQTKTIDIGEFGTTKLSDTPQTKFSWQSFTPLRNQIEAQSGLTKSE